MHYTRSQIKQLKTGIWTALRNHIIPPDYKEQKSHIFHAIKVAKEKKRIEVYDASDEEYTVILNGYILGLILEDLRRRNGAK